MTPILPRLSLELQLDNMMTKAGEGRVLMEAIPLLDEQSP